MKTYKIVEIDGKKYKQYYANGEKVEVQPGEVLEEPEQHHQEAPGLTITSDKPKTPAVPPMPEVPPMETPAPVPAEQPTEVPPPPSHEKTVHVSSVSEGMEHMMENEQKAMKESQDAQKAMREHQKSEAKKQHKGN